MNAKNALHAYKNERLQFTCILVKFFEVFLTTGREHFLSLLKYFQYIKCMCVDTLCQLFTNLFHLTGLPSCQEK